MIAPARQMLRETSNFRASSIASCDAEPKLVADCPEDSIAAIAAVKRKFSRMTVRLKLNSVSIALSCSAFEDRMKLSNVSLSACDFISCASKVADKRSKSSLVLKLDSVKDKMVA